MRTTDYFAINLQSIFITIACAIGVVLAEILFLFSLGWLGSEANLVLINASILLICVSCIVYLHFVTLLRWLNALILSMVCIALSFSFGLFILSAIVDKVAYPPVSNPILVSLLNSKSLILGVTNLFLVITLTSATRIIRANIWPRIVLAFLISLILIVFIEGGIGFIVRQIPASDKGLRDSFLLAFYTPLIWAIVVFVIKSF